MECPVKCGRCCYDPEYPDDNEEPCHYWSKTGCRLPRSERPDFCNYYMCKRAEEALKSPASTGLSRKLSMNMPLFYRKHLTEVTIP